MMYDELSDCERLVVLGRLYEGLEKADVENIDNR